MKPRKLLSTFLLFCIALCTFSIQGQSRYVGKVDKEFSELSFQDVIERSELYLSNKNLQKEDKQYLHEKLAEAYYRTKNYTKAEENYRILNDMGVSLVTKPEVLLHYAQVLSANKKYKESSQIYTTYASLDNSYSSANDIAYVQTNQEPYIRNVQSYNIDYLSINSSNAEFSPRPYKNGLVFVGSGRGSGAVKFIFEWDDSPFLDLYFLPERSLIEKSYGGASVSASPMDNIKSKVLGRDNYTPQTANDAKTLSYKANGSDKEVSGLATSKFDGKLNSVYHEGPFAFFNNQNSVMLTRNGILGFDYNAEDGINRIHLYLADIANDKWTNFRAFPYNSAEYSTGHPAFTPDEKYLFFVSDMPGGFGGTDIYYCKVVNGLWQKPVNAGSKINTSGNEMFPFIDEQNNLYFSSDGHPGLGSLDIFMVPLDPESKPRSTVHNLGAPINSTWDDFGIYTDAAMNSGYFSSNRKNGNTDDDIYKFTRTGNQLACKDIEILVKESGDIVPKSGFAVNYYNVAEPKKIETVNTNSEGLIRLCLKVDQEYYFEVNDPQFQKFKKYFSTYNISDFRPTKFQIELLPAPVEEPKKPEIIDNGPKLMVRVKDNISEEFYNGKIFDSRGNPLEGVEIRFTNKCTDESISLITGTSGEYKFKRNPECDYEFVASKETYASSYEFVEKTSSPFIAKLKNSVSRKKTETKVTESLFDQNIFKVGDVIKMENIYYDTDDYILSASAKNDLAKLAEVLEKYPDMIMELYSHTDSRGNANQNLLLSQKRANEVKEYIVRKGISPARIRATGMGEMQPVNNCGDGIQCTEAEYRRNRRTEFRMLKIQRI